MVRRLALTGIGVWALWLVSLAVVSRPESCGIELVPFADIRQSLRGAAVGLDLQLRLVFANIAAFVPLGYLIGFGGLGRLARAALAGFGVSAAIEAVQYLTCRGATTTDDLLLNTSGAVVGYLAWKAVHRLTARMSSSEVPERQERSRNP